MNPVPVPLPPQGGEGTRRAILGAVVAVIVTAAGLWAAQGSSRRWDAERAATCMPDSCFCEADRGGAIRQPANTWSCLGFVAVGCLIFLLPRRHSANPFVAETVYARTYGSIVAALGWGSMWFHGTLTFRGEWADAMSMHLLPSFLIVHNLRRGGALKPGGFLPAFCALAALNGLYLAASTVFRKQTFGLLLGALIVTELWARRRAAFSGEPGLFNAAFGLFAAAFAIWILDFTRAVCAPASWLQGHAAWHLLCAAAAGVLFAYYRCARLEPATGI